MSSRSGEYQGCDDGILHCSWYRCDSTDIYRIRYLNSTLCYFTLQSLACKQIAALWRISHSLFRIATGIRVIQILGLYTYLLYIYSSATRSCIVPTRAPNRCERLICGKILRSRCRDQVLGHTCRDSISSSSCCPASAYSGSIPMLPPADGALVTPARQ